MNTLIDTLQDKGLFENIDAAYLESITAAYTSAHNLLIPKIPDSSYSYWLVLYTIKLLYLKTIVFVDIETLIKFILVPKNLSLFKAYYDDNNKDILKTARLVARKFSEAYGMTPNFVGLGAVFVNDRADEDFFEYKVVNHTSELGLTIEEFLNEYGKEGWELVTIKQTSYFFKRKIIDDFLHI